MNLIDCYSSDNYYDVIDGTLSNRKLTIMRQTIKKPKYKNTEKINCHLVNQI